jgi:hypothetical protein
MALSYLRLELEKHPRFVDMQSLASWQQPQVSR